MKTPIRLLVFPLLLAAAGAQSLPTQPPANSPSSAATVAAVAAAAAAGSIAVPSVATGATTVATAAPGSGNTTPVATVVAVVPPPSGTVPPPLAASLGETSVTLDVGFGIRPVPAARIAVPVGEKLRIAAPQIGDTAVNYIWTKNGRAIVGAPDAPVLTLDFVTSADAGVYACLLSTPATLPRPSQSLVLGVGPTDRLLNLSVRGEVGAGPAQGLTTGFVVAAASGGKKLIVRAVGPSLALFGVANPLRQPVLRIYDGTGKLYDNGYAYPAVVGGPNYADDLAGSLAAAGAFPLPAGTRDVVEMKPFVPGSYTATVTSGDGTAGTVLLEIYEVP